MLLLKFSARILILYYYSPEQTLLSIVLQSPPDSHQDCVAALLKHWTTSYPLKLGEAFSCHSSLQTTLYVCLCDLL